MKKRIGTNQFVVVASLALLATSCSMKDRQVNYGISVSLPTANLGSSALNGAQISGVNVPTSINDFQCFALNITGPGLKSDPRFGCNDPSKADMGLIAGMAPVAGGKIDAMVPAGATRTIQLIGLQSTVGCPSFEELLSKIDPATGQGGMQGVGDAYLLGQTTVDVFGDVTVNIKAQFDPTAQLFKGCDNGGQKTLVFTSANDHHAVLRGSTACVPFRVEAHGNNITAGSLPSVVPTLTAPSPSGTATLFIDQACTQSYIASASPAPTPLQFSGSNGSIPLWIRVMPTVSSFTAQAVSSDTTWLQPAVVYKAVDHMIGLAPMPSPSTVQAPGIASCVKFPVRLIDQGGSYIDLAAAQQIDMRVYNNTTNGSTYSSTEFYLTAGDCAGQINKILPQPSTGGDHQLKYSFSFPAAPADLYVRNANTEQISVSFSGTDDTIAPTNMGYYFLPFQIAYASPSPAPATIVSLNPGVVITIPFITGGNSVTNIMIGNKQATIGAKGDSFVSFVPPPMTAAEQTAMANYVAQVGIQGAGGFVSYIPSDVGVTYAPYDSGDGLGTPFTVSTTNAFMQLGDFRWSTRYFIQAADLDFNGMNNGGYPYVNSFYGQYDGQAHLIRNLQSGMFRDCYSGSAIQNFTIQNAVVNASIAETNVGLVCANAAPSSNLAQISVMGINTLTASSTGSIGGIAGTSYASMTGLRVQNLSINTSAGSAIGGLIGTNSGSLTGSYCLQCAISATGAASYVGGLIGQHNGGVIQSSFVTGSGINVPSMPQAVGGIVGYLTGGTISETFVTNPGSNFTVQGAAASGGQIGGFVGKMTGGTIHDSFAKANVSGYSNVGGFVGTMASGAPQITNCYSYSSTISGTSAVFGFVGSKIAGTISGGNYYQHAGINTDVTVGVTYLSVNPDSLANYPGYSGSLWKSNIATASNSSSTPVLSWACGAATPLGLACY